MEKTAIISLPLQSEVKLITADASISTTVQQHEIHLIQDCTEEIWWMLCKGKGGMNGWHKTGGDRCPEHKRELTRRAKWGWYNLNFNHSEISRVWTWRYSADPTDITIMLCRWKTQLKTRRYGHAESTPLRKQWRPQDGWGWAKVNIIHLQLLLCQRVTAACKYTMSRRRFNHGRKPN